MEKHQAKKPRQEAAKAPEPVEEQKLVQQMRPVDRHLETEAVLRSAVWNESKVRPRPTVFFTSQMLGNGKSFFCEHMIEIAATEPVERLLKADFAAVPGDTRWPALEEMREQQGAWPAALIAKWRSARTIYVDLAKDVSEPEGDATFRKLLYHAIYEKATGHAIAPAELFKFGSTAKHLLAAIRARTGHAGPFFIPLDEIGAMEERWTTLKEMEPKEGEIEGTNRLHSGPYRVLFEAVKDLATERDVIVFCAGKSQAMIEYAVRPDSTRITSPIILQFLPLGPFSVEDLLAIFRTANWKGNVLQDTLLWLERAEEKEVKLRLLAEAIIRRTGGVPRLVEFVLKYLTYKPSAGTLESALRALDAEVKQKSLAEINRCGRPSITGRMQVALATLASMHILHIPIEDDLELPLENRANRALDTAINLGLYFRRVGEGTYELVVGEWTSELYLKSMECLLFTTISGLIAHVSHLPAVYAQGRLLEVCFVSCGSVRCQFAQAIADVPGLGLSTFLKDAAAVDPRSRAPSAFSVEPVAGFYRPKKKDEEPDSGEEEPEPSPEAVRDNFSTAEWGRFVEYLAAPERLNKFCLPVMLNSAGPDALLPLEDAENPGRLAQLAMFQLRNLQSKSSSSWDDVAKEVESCLSRPRNCEGVDPELKLVLFFVSTQLDENIGGVFKQLGAREALVFGEGKWGYQQHGSGSKKAAKFECTSKEAPRNFEFKFEIPPDCELVIWSRETVGAFFGRGQLEALGAYYSNANVQSRCRALASFQSSLFEEFVGMKNQVTGELLSPSSKKAAPRAVVPVPPPDFGPPPAARAAVNPLFADPKKKIDLAWLQDVANEFFPGKDLEKLKLWLSRLLDNEVDDVRTLAKQTKADLMDYKIPGEIARSLVEQAALCPK